MISNLKRTKRIWTAWLPGLTVLAIIPVLAAAFAISSARAADKGSIVALAYDAGGGALLKSDGEAVYRSGNNGDTWQAIPLPPSANGSIAAVATPAKRSGVVYVAGPGLGVLRTEDDGASWVALNTGLPSTKVTAFTAHAALPEAIYAFVPESGIYRSQDAGKSWKLMDRGPENTRQLLHTDMKGSMETGWLYAATLQGARVSMDCFCLWRDAGELNGKVDSLAYDPLQPERLYAASDQGLFRSTNGGQDWEQTASPEAAVTTLTATPSGALYAASTDGALFRSLDRAETWEPIGD
ncbi:WD40/YVTN/BNR-like repeat-containing protein [Allomesorhizobium camelthorni]|uniref:DUF6242 domain-containing protein n=1 Tax=Allomesorhizobium camelthorni TaxID=475069 RepID=A0A6G4WKM7_9HYPH|nr:hypothetical protein [Mesorhizobium camelthorni]NGO55159.1 hypothetical protein [Mesorhizobium camelthorni]